MIPPSGTIAFWVVALVVFLIVEAVTAGLVSIWFVFGSLVALICAALGAAVRQGIVGANVTCLVTPPAREAPHHRFYDSSQLRMLFCASEGTPLEVAVKLAGCLGLRRSEICGLKWRNVDLKRGVLTVCEVRTAVSGRALEKAPKSYASERRLAFGGNEDLESLLKRLHRDWERRRKQ